MPITEDKDTEITLGTGKMLVLFFGLVALCAAFFGLGFKMGKTSSSPITVSGDTITASPASASIRPSAVKPATSPDSAASDVAFYKSTSQKADDAQPSAGDTAKTSNDSSNTVTTKTTDTTGTPAVSAAPADPSTPPSTNGYYVQVAAVSRQEDGDALVDALKKKQYPAFSSSGADKLYHVQVGPFSDIKSAEDTRAKLTNDGYNPILKK